MNTYQVLLGIDNGPRDTKRRLSLSVPADNRLSAAIVAEKVGDQYLNDSTGSTYTHAISVKMLHIPKANRIRMTAA